MNSRESMLFNELFWQSDAFVFENDSSVMAAGTCITITIVVSHGKYHKWRWIRWQVNSREEMNPSTLPNENPCVGRNEIQQFISKLFSWLQTFIPIHLKLGLFLACFWSVTLSVWRGFCFCTTESDLLIAWHVHHFEKDSAEWIFFVWIKMGLLKRNKQIKWFV